MTSDDFFTHLRRKKPIIYRQAAAEKLFFQLDFDEIGAYVRMTNTKGKEIVPAAEMYAGTTREILRLIESIQEKQSFQIDWESPSDRVYLKDSTPLLRLLEESDNFVGNRMKKVRFAEKPGTLSVRVTKAKDRIQGTPVLVHRRKLLSNPQLIDESHVYCQSTIYRVTPMGSRSGYLKYFETALPASLLERYLSLLFSHIEGVQVDYDGYQVETGRPMRTQPTLIFEQVDDDDTLHLRLSGSFPGFDADFFDEFEINRVATVNDAEKTISVCEVIHEDTAASYKDIRRRLMQHRRALKTDRDFFADDNFFIIQPGLADRFLRYELPELVGRYTFLGAERLTSFKVRPVKPKLNLTLSHGIDFLEGDAALSIDGEKFALFDVLNQYKKNAYITLSDGTYGLVNQSYINKLSRIFKRKKKGVTVSFFDLPAVEELIDEKIAGESFDHARKVFLGFNTLSRQRTRYPKLKAKLRTYQKQGYKWATYLKENKLGGCLADDMGLGKTIQAIALLASVYPAAKQPSLVVMPRSLLFNWENEIDRFYPELTHYTYHGNKRDIKEATSNRVILTTYAMVRNDIETFRSIKFHYIILDESQNIKNMESQISKAVMLLDGAHRLALSGTPIENNISELYALFRFLNPAMFGSARDFNRDYLVPIQKEDDKEVRRELKKKIYPFILRRLKQEVLKDLPDKVEKTIFVEMTPEQQNYYEQRRLFYHHAIRQQISENGFQKSRFFILQAMGELRQIAAIPEMRSENGIRSPKRPILMEQVGEAIANSHKVLIFANYLHALDCLSQDLNELEIDHLLMTGATRDRKTLVEQFQTDETLKVFLMTLKTGGIGLNLTAADHIFIFDPWWNRAAENQAIDRTHRIGQKNTVFSYRLITRGTIEEKILELQEYKKALFDELITSDGASLKSLDETDVEFVLGV
ncbi:MAG: DEAD/DEAH box helicase [Desulfobacteraceae bacterium]|nr:DEAD/DEAH box helicase [Desulfobacteraceae bacterium]